MAQVSPKNGPSWLKKKWPRWIKMGKVGQSTLSPLQQKKKILQVLGSSLTILCPHLLFKTSSKIKTFHLIQEYISVLSYIYINFFWSCLVSKICLIFITNIFQKSAIIQEFLSNVFATTGHGVFSNQIHDDHSFQKKSTTAWTTYCLFATRNTNDHWSESWSRS